MEGLSPAFKWVETLQYEIVEKKFNRARLIIYCNDVGEKDIHISYNGKKLTIYGFSDYTHVYRLDVNLWFKIRKLNYRFKNGILTIDVKGYRFIPYPPI